MSKKQTGYRVRLTVFVPCDHGDTASVKGAMEYVEELQTCAVGSEVPHGTVIESFSSSLGKRDAE